MKHADGTARDPLPAVLGDAPRAPPSSGQKAEPSSPRSSPRRRGSPRRRCHLPGALLGVHGKIGPKGALEGDPHTGPAGAAGHPSEEGAVGIRWWRRSTAKATSLGTRPSARAPGAPMLQGLAGNPGPAGGLPLPEEVLGRVSRPSGHGDGPRGPHSPPACLPGVPPVAPSRLHHCSSGEPVSPRVRPCLGGSQRPMTI